MNGDFITTIGIRVDWEKSENQHAATRVPDYFALLVASCRDRRTHPMQGATSTRVQQPLRQRATGASGKVATPPDPRCDAIATGEGERVR